MNHDVFEHAGAWVIFALNIIGIGLIVYRGGKAMGSLGSSVSSLATSVAELKTEVGGLRDELVTQGKQIARAEGERRAS